MSFCLPCVPILHMLDIVLTFFRHYVWHAPNTILAFVVALDLANVAAYCLTYLLRCCMAFCFTSCGECVLGISSCICKSDAIWHLV